MGWHFVQDSGCKKGQDAATRRYVRSTVARNHYRKERQQLVQSQAIDDEQERNEADQAGPEAFLDLVDSKDARASIRVQARGQMSARRQKDLTHKDAKVAHGSAYSYHSDPWSLALANSTTNGGSDPFGIAAAGVAYQSGHDSLLHHFISIVVPFYCPFGYEAGRDSLRHALSTQQSLADAALYQSILFAASVHQDYCLGGEVSRTSLKHKVETIRLINASLVCAPDRVSDLTLAAIGMLAVSQNLTKDSSEQRVHLDAAKALVKLRGGVNSLALTEVLHMFICWQDYICSITTTEKPGKFIQIHCNAFLRSPSWFNFQGIQNHIEEKIGRLDLPEEIQDILLPMFRDLNLLNDLLEPLWRGNVSNGPTYMAFTQMRSSLDHRAIDLLAAPRQITNPYHSTLIGTCMATLAFTHVALRDFHPACAAVRTAKETLFKHFDCGWHTPTMPLEEARRWWSLRLWALCVSAMTALDDEELSWYAPRIAQCASGLELHVSSPVQRHLERYIWTFPVRTSFDTRTWPKVRTLLTATSECNF